MNVSLHFVQANTMAPNKGKMFVYEAEIVAADFMIRLNK